MLHVFNANRFKTIIKMFTNINTQSKVQLQCCMYLIQIDSKTIKMFTNINTQSKVLFNFNLNSFLAIMIIDIINKTDNENFNMFDILVNVGPERASNGVQFKLI